MRVYVVIHIEADGKASATSDATDVVGSKSGPTSVKAGSHARHPSARSSGFAR